MATYDFYAGYVELAARMFGGYVIYTFDPVTKVLLVFLILVSKSYATITDFEGKITKVVDA